MDSRFQWRLLFHCFQGLFLRSHMGLCDECPRQGVFSDQLPRRCCPHLPTAARLSRGCCVGGFISDPPVAPDKSHHPEVGGRKNLKATFISMHNFARGSLTRNCPLECICSPCWTLTIHCLLREKTAVLTRLRSALSWDILTKEHVC